MLFLFCYSSYLKDRCLHLFFKFSPFSWTASVSSSVTFCLFFFFHAADSVSVDLWVFNCFKLEKLTMFEFPLLLVKIFYIRFSLINMNAA